MSSKSVGFVTLFSNSINRVSFLQQKSLRYFQKMPNLTQVLPINIAYKSILINSLWCIFWRAVLGLKQKLAFVWFCWIKGTFSSGFSLDIPSFLKILVLFKKKNRKKLKEIGHRGCIDGIDIHKKTKQRQKKKTDCYVCHKKSTFLSQEKWLL